MMTDARNSDRDHPSRLGPPVGRRWLMAAGLALGEVAAVNVGRAATPAVATATLPASAIALNKKLLPGFEPRFIPTNGLQVDGVMAEGAINNTLIGGSGPPLMLIHGYPENHLSWHKIVGEGIAKSTGAGVYRGGGRR